MTHDTALNQEQNIRALALHLSIKYSEAEELIKDGNWLSLTDDEADKEASERIESSLWAFNYDFLCGHIPELCALDKSIWNEMISNACESANDFIKRLIGSDYDFAKFVNAAVRANGHAHFLSPYDGAEEEQQVNGTWYYLYRQN